MLATVRRLGKRYIPRRKRRLAARESGKPSSCCSKLLIATGLGRSIPPPRAGRDVQEFPRDLAARYPRENQNVSYLLARPESRNPPPPSNTKSAAPPSRRSA